MNYIVVLSCLAFLMAAADLQAAPPVPTYTDISYGPHPHQVMDIYLPPDGKGPFPVVVWFGGIWKSGKGIDGSSRLFPCHCAEIGVEMRSMGDAVGDNVAVPISYVLLDARRAFQFIRLHARDYNLDPDRMATAGASQGSLPALYVACSGEKANPAAADPVERMSTKVTCVAALISQPSLDPKQMQEWVPGVKWGAPALGCDFDTSLQKRDQLLPIIKQWSPDELIDSSAPPIFFLNSWGLTKPATVEEMPYLVHSPLWALGFQKLAQSRGATVYVDYPGHSPEKYNDVWDFLVQELTAK